MNPAPPTQSVLAWMGQTLSRPSSRGDAISEMEANSSDSPSKKKGVLYLPAYFVRGDDGSSSGSQQLSPSSSASSQHLQGSNGLSPLSLSSFGPNSMNGANGTGQSLGQWASSLLPVNWRGPSPAPSHGSRRSRLSQDVDLESLGSQDQDDDRDDAWDARGASTAAAEQQPLMSGGRQSGDYPRSKSAVAAMQALEEARNEQRSPAPPPYDSHHQQQQQQPQSGSTTTEDVSLGRDEKQQV